MRCSFHLVATSLLLAACTDTVIQTRDLGTTKALITTADVRIITERPAILPTGRPIICAEPTPDVAKALSTAFEAAANVSSGKVTAGGNAANATAEQLAELSGRIPGTIALRDGLFRACEAYANGLIGSDAYALILSRYGDLLITLLLAEAIPTSSSAEVAKLTGYGLTLPAPSTPPAANSGAPSTTPAAKPASTTTASLTPAGSLISLVGNPATNLPAPPAAAASKPAQPATPASGTTPPAAQNAGSGPSTAPAAQLAAMQAKYLDQSHIGPLLVACINAYDTTRGDAQTKGVVFDGSHNSLLHDFCPDFLKAVGATAANQAPSASQARRTAR